MDPLTSRSERKTAAPSVKLNMPAADLPVWQQAVNERRQQINSAIPAAWILPRDVMTPRNSTRLPYTAGIMTERELKITECRAVELLELIKSKIYSAVDVTTAFCKRAAIAHQAVSICRYHLIKNADIIL